jgi:glycosyltransferase involved in cell wall biosynthesis
MLSVGIATWNRADQLARTLEALASVRVPESLQWEVLICDNGSTDATRRVAEAATAQLPIRYLREPRLGKSFALNRLLDEAQGEWLLLLDDDAEPCRDWLTAYARGIEAHPDAVCLGGPIEVTSERGVGATAAFLMREFPGVYGALRVEREVSMADSGRGPFGANMAVRRATAAGIGFDVSRGMFGSQRVAGEDVAMVARLLAEGPGWLLPKAGVSHRVAGPLGLSRFLRWHVGLGTAMADPAERLRARRQLAKWTWKAVRYWRPWRTRTHYAALGEVAKYYGYLRAKPRRRS